MDWPQASVSGSELCERAGGESVRVARSVRLYCQRARGLLTCLLERALHCQGLCPLRRRCVPLCLFCARCGRARFFLERPVDPGTSVAVRRPVLRQILNEWDCVGESVESGVAQHWLG